MLRVLEESKQKKIDPLLKDMARQSGGYGRSNYYGGRGRGGRGGRGGGGGRYGAYFRN